MDRPLITIASALLLGILGPSPAAAGVRGVVRFGGSYLEPSATIEGARASRFSIGVFTYYDVMSMYSLEAEDAWSPFVDFELRVSDRVGVEVSAVQPTFDLGVRLIQDYVVTTDPENGPFNTYETFDHFSGTLDTTYLTVGVNLHPFPRRRADFYFGPLGGLGLYENARFTPPDYDETVEVENHPIYGAVIGLDMPLGKSRWLFSTGLRAFRARVEFERVPQVIRTKLFNVGDENPDDLSLDPIELRLGIARRFGRSEG